MDIEGEINDLQNKINSHASAIIDHYDSIIELEIELADKKSQFELEQRIRERVPKLRNIMRKIIDLKYEEY